MEYDSLTRRAQYLEQSSEWTGVKIVQFDAKKYWDMHFEYRIPIKKLISRLFSFFSVRIIAYELTLDERRLLIRKYINSLKTT